MTAFHTPDSPIPTFDAARPSLELLAAHLGRINTQLEKVLREHDALRTTNRELSAENKELRKTNNGLRRKWTRQAAEKT